MKFLPRDCALELLSLPNEVLEEVLVWLDCSSIFSARLTCRKIYNLSKTRHLWSRLITRLQLEHGLVPPEEDMQDYGIEELERWILRRSSARAAWQSEPPANSHIRCINFRTLGVGVSCPLDPYFLPGGRWLLLADASSRMHALDLDAMKLTPTCLFNLSDFDKKLISKYFCYSLWTDYSSPRLCFHVAGNAPDEDNSPTIIYTAKLTGHGANASLAASLVSAFHTYGHQGHHLRQFALNKRYYAEVRCDPNDGNIGIILAYQFREVSGGRGYSSIKPTAQARFLGNSLVCEHPPFLHINSRRLQVATFIYDNVFAICTLESKLLLYEIVCPESVPSGKPFGSFNLLYTTAFAHQPCPDIRWSPSESYMVSMYHGEFMGLRIPHDRTIPPTVVKLGKHDTFIIQQIGSIFGTSISISMGTHDDPVEIVSHPWTQAGDGTLSLDCLKRSSNGPRVPHLCARSELVRFSEDLGRLLFFQDGSQSSIVVVDLTAAHYLHE